MSKEATIYYKRLASLLSVKWTQHYSTIISWVRCIISFSLMRFLGSSVHSRPGHPIGPVCCPIDLVRSETHFAV